MTFLYCDFQPSNPSHSEFAVLCLLLTYLLDETLIISNVCIDAVIYEWTKALKHSVLPSAKTKKEINQTNDYQPCQLFMSRLTQPELPYRKVNYFG